MHVGFKTIFIGLSSGYYRSVEVETSVLPLQGQDILLFVDGQKNQNAICGYCGRREDRTPDADQRDRTRMKILPIDPNSDLPVEVLEEVLEEARTFYR